MEAGGAGVVRHWHAHVNGVSLLVAEQDPASALAVFLLHGFPELWLLWRHQMASLAAHGIRTLTPDLRGYGDSDGPADPAVYKEPGRAERAFARYDVATVLKKFYAIEIDELNAPPGVEIIDFLDTPSSLPAWITEDELGQYAEKFQKTGFTGPLNYYRIMDTNWRLTAPWQGAQITMPAKFIVGDKDLGFRSFGTDVPRLEVAIIEGHHFLRQEQAERVNSEILSYLDKFTTKEA